MTTPDLSTCWTVIRAAASGAAGEREVFARTYEGPLRAYFARRWQGAVKGQEIEDAVQEVFVECLRPGGALAKADEEREGGFKAFLYGVARNVARRFDERAAARRQKQAVGTVELDALPADEATLSRAFDRAWAQALLREAAVRQAELAAGKDDAQRRVELLRRRFGDGTPIRDLAHEWGVEPDVLHHEYARARKEFLEALRGVVAFHQPDASAGAIARQCEELARLLSA